MNKKFLFVLCGLAVITLCVCFYYTPHWAVSNMKEAAENRDADTLSEYVDFPALKESLKTNFNAMMVTEVSNNMSDNPFGAFGAALATAFINPMIDNLVTPESLAMMMKGEKPELEKTNRENEKDKSDTDENTETTMKYDDFNSFIVTVKEKGSSEDPVKMIFKRHGIVSWKLTALRLPSPDKESKHAAPSDSSKTAIETKHTGKTQKASGQTKPEPASPVPALLTPTLSNKRFQKSDFTNGIMEDAIWFDVVWDTSRLKRKTRAVKGVLVFGDIFGDTKLRLRWTINEPLVPNVIFVEKGVGFGFNQFTSSHKWVRSTDLKDMKFSFDVDEIIYQDESSRTVNNKNIDSASLIEPVLTNKRFQKSDFTNGIYEDAIWFDINWDTSKLQRKTRAIKGILVLGDIFGEPQFRINMTINDPLTPRKNYTQQGIGFDYNQFTDSHKWVRFTELKDMTFAFEAKDIIYADEIKDAEQKH
ncbi:MAG: DUF2939 domain-containing protein [Desulfobacterium sp.]|nr:DUF2939 domain-containing protein [Desulfobacterium sp.]